MNECLKVYDFERPGPEGQDRSRSFSLHGHDEHEDKARTGSSRWKERRYGGVHIFRTYAV